MYTADELAAMGEHIRLSDGVIMLLAPDEQLDNVDIAAEGGGRRRIDEVLNAMYGAFNNSGTKLAVVVSKSDKLRNEALYGNKNSILFREVIYNTGAPGFMEDEAEKVNAHICDLVGNTLLKQVRREYPAAKYFAVSTLGGEALENGSVAPLTINSTRLEEPIAWILSELGIIDKVSNKKWTYNGIVVDRIKDGENV